MSDVVYCGACKHCVRRDPTNTEIFSFISRRNRVWKCAARPQVSNLKSFPFCCTQCPKFEPKEKVS